MTDGQGRTAGRRRLVAAVPASRPRCLPSTQLTSSSSVSVGAFRRAAPRAATACGACAEVFSDLFVHLCIFDVPQLFTKISLFVLGSLGAVRRESRCRGQWPVAATCVPPPPPQRQRQKPLQTSNSDCPEAHVAKRKLQTTTTLASLPPLCRLSSSPTGTVPCPLFHFSATAQETLTTGVGCDLNGAATHGL